MKGKQNTTICSYQLHGTSQWHKQKKKTHHFQIGLYSLYVIFMSGTGAKGYISPALHQFGIHKNPPLINALLGSKSNIISIDGCHCIIQLASNIRYTKTEQREISDMSQDPRGLLSQCCLKDQGKFTAALAKEHVSL